LFSAASLGLTPAVRAIVDFSNALGGYPYAAKK